MPPSPLATRPSARPTLPSFQQVYAESAAFVWRTLRRLGVRDADLEDVSQETFVVVHRKLAEFDGGAAVRTWLFGICRRVASDYRRKAHVLRETTVAELPEGTQAPEQVEVVARRQARALLDRLLDELDEDKRAVFVLFELEQWPMAEVAQAVGCPVQTAYARLYAAREWVQRAVARARAEGGER
ncbi:RNA polymerase sigma factor [Archangium lansingense]|uniref:Sigma-70 family RNA polymerase sigma factor n=1 Tax=Archangium lansingense TaxID=2995310 RepID=A0ABT4AQN1_9BACT|nr:sigma-70 family RNA polymerase sigma factor [Archangium lansinium]MCY1083479.1 sigma-70 family RNA polymerase sigma factor [Archangium lansinium]